MRQVPDDSTTLNPANELSQIESRMGPYTSNSSAFIKEFWYITQSYSLTFHDVHMMFAI